MATGVLYGCEAPGMTTENDEEGFYGIMDGFNAHAKLGWDHPRVRIEIEGGKSLVGVWVAVGGSGEDGAPYFVEKCVRLDQFASVYVKSVNKAAKLWARFVKYVAKEHQIDLPAATLWITPCEVA